MEAGSDGGARGREDLEAQVQGSVLGPGDPGYDEARRVFNARFESRPDLVVRCASPADVAAAVDVAREEGLSLCVKGGGHDYAGNSACSGGLLVDLSGMDEVRVDPERGVVVAGPGATWAGIDAATQALGLATTGCTVSTVGVSGYTLGGGTGYLSRKHGIAADNLVGAEVITAAGELVRASEEENPGLFWALRGGSGNFGVVTSFELRLHEVGPEVLAGQIAYAVDDAADVLRAYRDFMDGAPDELVCYPFFLRVPPIEAFPEEYHGEVAVDLVLSWAGETARGEEVIRPLREIAEPILDWVEPQPYTVVQQAFDEGLSEGSRWYTRAHYLSGLPDEAIETLVRFGGDLRGPHTMAYLEPLGGAIGRVDPTATAFPHRDAPLGFHVLAGWDDPAQDDGIMEWVREFYGAMEPWATGGVYVNLLGEDEDDRVPAAFRSNYERLQAVKRAWDPKNLFRNNHNIPPGE